MDGGLESEAHRTDINDPVYLERMEMVYDQCPCSSVTCVVSRGYRRGTSRPRLVHLPLQGQPGAQQMGPTCKGDTPYPNGRRDLPQLGLDAASPVT